MFSFVLLLYNYYIRVYIYMFKFRNYSLMIKVVDSNVKTIRVFKQMLR